MNSDCGQPSDILDKCPEYDFSAWGVLVLDLQL